MLAYRRDSRNGDHVRGLERFYVPYFDMELGEEDEAFITALREWITKLSKETPEELRSKSDQEPTESEFFKDRPTYSHARMLFRTVLENGFVRRARHTGKMYEVRDLMPDSAVIRNFFGRGMLESPGEVSLRFGSFQYFSAIVAFYAQRNLSWILLETADSDALGVWARKNLLKNWKGERTHSRLVKDREKYWSLFLSFCIVGLNNQEVLSDPEILMRMLAAVIGMSETRTRS